MTDARVTIQEVRQALEKALEGREVFVHLNGTAEGVELPPSLAGNPNVTLKLSYYYRGPLTVGEEKVEADLIFPEGAHTCVVPLTEVWGVTSESGESSFWPEHAPREVLEQMIRGASVASEKGEEDENPAEMSKAKRAASHIKVAKKDDSVKESTSEPSDQSEKPTDAAEEKPKARPVLKLIK